MNRCFGVPPSISAAQMPSSLMMTKVENVMHKSAGIQNLATATCRSIRNPAKKNGGWSRCSWTIALAARIVLQMAAASCNTPASVSLYQQVLPLPFYRIHEHDLPVTNIEKCGQGRVASAKTVE